MFQFFGAGGKGWVVGTGIKGGFDLLQGVVERLQVLRGEKVALGLAQFAEMAPQIGGLAELAGEKPAQYHVFLFLTSDRIFPILWAR